MTTVVVLGLVALCLLAFGGTGTESGWATASVTNDTDKAVTGTMAITHAYGGQTCSTSQQVTAVSCAPTLGSQQSLGSSADTITNNSVATAGQSFSEQVKVESCGLVQLTNSRGSDADPMLPRGRTSFQVADPWGSTSAISFNGVNGFASDVSQTGLGGSLLGSSPSMSLGVWFNAPAGSHGGGLLSLSGNGDASGSSGADPVIWMDSAGKLHFGANFGGLLGSGQTSVASSADLRGTGWHLATLTVSSGLLSSTLTGYLDGSSVNSAGSLGILSTGGSGYWHIGWADLTGWSPTGDLYFDGAESGAYFVGGSAQSAATLLAAYNTKSSGSAANYASALGSLTNLWMLGDDGMAGVGTPAYAATPSGTTWLPAQPLCGTVNVTWTLGSATAYAGSLGALPSAWQPTVGLSGPGANGGTQTATIATSKGSGYNSVEAGLHLYVPLDFQILPTGGPGWTHTFTWKGSPLDVFWA